MIDVSVLYFRDLFPFHELWWKGVQLAVYSQYDVHSWRQLYVNQSLCHSNFLECLVQTVACHGFHDMDDPSFLINNKKYLLYPLNNMYLKDITDLTSILGHCMSFGQPRICYMVGKCFEKNNAVLQLWTEYITYYVHNTKGN
jgi:hypothetical protein